jgi:hypothetical protein|tara:strand:+ start:581 stop:838 length:258 start_codon:yes stop_codon:yes gene_type:complete
VDGLLVVEEEAHTTIHKTEVVMEDLGMDLHSNQADHMLVVVMVVTVIHLPKFLDRMQLPTLVVVVVPVLQRTLSILPVLVDQVLL